MKRREPFCAAGFYSDQRGDWRAVGGIGTEDCRPVRVVFVKPEGFTDTRHSKTERSSPAPLLQRQRFIFDTAAQPKRLKVKTTDVNLAGDFDLFRGPQCDHVLVTKSIYRPRSVFEFRVVDAGDRTFKEGQRQLTDLHCQLRVDDPREEPSHYHEKESLRDWLRDRTGVLHASIAG